MSVHVLVGVHRGQGKANPDGDLVSGDYGSQQFLT